MAVGERRRVKHGDGFTGGGRGGLRYISVYICEIIHCPTRWTPATTFRREHVFCCCRPRGVNIHCEFLLYYFIYIYICIFFLLLFVILVYLALYPFIHNIIIIIIIYIYDPSKCTGPLTLSSIAHFFLFIYLFFLILEKSCFGHRQ